MARESAYGVDTSATKRVHVGRTVTGAELVAEALFRRLTTERGTLLDDPSYGWSLQRWLGSEWTEARSRATPGLIRQEGRKDDRLEEGSLVVDFQETRGDNAAVSLEITISAVTTEGESFDLVISASSVTVELLRITVR